MTKIAIGIEYDGSAYSGWQTQSALATVQEHAAGALAKVAAEPVILTAAGRTDAGVHARGQVAHFETTAMRSSRSWVLGANAYLPADINLLWARVVPNHFHSRYTAEARTYRYFILNRAVRSSLAWNRATWIRHPLDQERMGEAAAVLVGEHDFSAFRAAGCQARSPIRRLEKLKVERHEEWLTIEATANAFLHHMMRNIVGLLITVGRGEQPPDWAGRVLASRNRTLGAPTAPSHGLYLWSVRYPPAFQLPQDQSAIIARLPDRGV